MLTPPQKLAAAKLKERALAGRARVRIPPAPR